RGGGVLGNEADAEDVTQDVLLQVVRKLHTFRGESALTSWLHRVTVNAAISLQRKRAVHREQQLGAEAGRCVEDRHPPGRAGVGRPDEQAQTEELSRLIVKAIDNLPHPYRQVLVLADVEELSYNEIGVRLGLSLQAVKSRLHRARLMARAALAPHYESGQRPRAPARRGAGEARPQAGPGPATRSAL